MRPCLLLLWMLSALAGSALADEGSPVVTFRLGSYEETARASEPHDGPWMEKTIYLEPEILLSEADIDSAFAREDQVEGNGANLLLTDEGARKLEKITRENLHRPLAILLEEQVLTAPMIQAPIPGGRVTISHFPDKSTRNHFLNVLEERGVGIGDTHVMPPMPSEEELAALVEQRQRELIAMADEGVGHYVPEDTLLASVLLAAGNPALTGDLEVPLASTMALRAVAIWDEQPPSNRRTWATGDLGSAIQTLAEAGELTTAQRLADTLFDIIFSLDWGPDHRFPMNWGIAELGDAYVRQGRVEEAERLYQRALEFEPRGTMWVCFRNLVSLRISQGRLDEAEQMCMEVMEDAGERLSITQMTAKDLLEKIDEARKED